MATCKLTITDEVNLKLSGLELDDRKKLANTFKYDVPGAKYQPAVRLGRWDGKVSFFQLGGSSYINLLPEILPMLDNMGYDIDVVDLRQYKTQFEFELFKEDTFSHILWPEGHPNVGQPIMFRDYQVEIINNFLQNPQSIQEIATGAGKCQPLSSKVLTPNGWVAIRDINIGDKVVTPTGKSVDVLGTFNPGVKDVYELTFSDGRVARSCADHIWKVYNIDWCRSKTGPWRNLSTSEIIAIKATTKRAIGIPLVSMENDNSDIELPMDPWLLGFLLGDGSFRNGKMGFSSADNELVDKVKSKISSDYMVKHVGNYDYCIKFASAKIQHAAHSALLKTKKRNALGHLISEPAHSSSANVYRQIINNFGLGETYSHTKFIPHIYFTASKEQRLELIRGLVDSDGTIDKGSVYFTSTSGQLASDFRELVHSVGGVAKIKASTNKTYVYNGTVTPCKDSYTVATKYPTPWTLTSLQRKQDKTGYSYQYADTLKLNIVSISKVSTEEVKCILIDDPDHLYVTNDYIVTHNTIITAALSKSIEPYGRSIIIVPNKSLVTQTEADYINMGLDVGVYFGDRKEFGRQHTICTWQSLNILLKKTQNGEGDITIGEFIEGVVLVMVDEVHMAKADALKTLLTGVFAHVPIRWGLTGTVPKEKYEQLSIFCSLGSVVGQLSASELQDAGHLAQCHVNVIQLYDTVEFKEYQSELKYLTENQDRIEYIARLINKIKDTGNTLVLIDRIATGKLLMEHLPDAVFVSGVTKGAKRKEEYDEIATSTDKIIVATYGVAAVGLNIPRIFNLVMVESGKSFTRVIQSIGRGIRKAEDKDEVVIWDITSTCKFSKRHLTARKKYYTEAKYPFTVEKTTWQ